MDKVPMCADAPTSEDVCCDAAPTEPPTRRAAKRPQFVYIIQCNGDDGPLKIGIAVDPQRRLSELRIGCPYPMQLLGYSPDIDPDMAERRLHAAHWKRRIHGEWFDCCDDLLELARSWRSAQARGVMALITAPHPKDPK